MRLWTETIAERIARLQMQTLSSEHNRRVKLEARPDAAKRIGDAAFKRARKGRKRLELSGVVVIGYSAL